MTGEFPQPAQHEESSEEVSEQLPDAPADQAPDSQFFTDYYNDEENGRPITKERKMLAATHFLEDMARTADDDEFGDEFPDPGPMLAQWIIMDEDPEVRAKAIASIEQAVDRGEVRGSIVASVVHQLSDLAWGHYHHAQRLKAQFPEDQM